MKRYIVVAILILLGFGFFFYTQTRSVRESISLATMADTFGYSEENHIAINNTCLSTLQSNTDCQITLTYFTDLTLDDIEQIASNEAFQAREPQSISQDFFDQLDPQREMLEVSFVDNTINGYMFPPKTIQSITYQISFIPSTENTQLTQTNTGNTKNIIHIVATSQR
ncbi:MAG: hypothetical protein AAGF95_18520 [Chloroflexota bacterium]